MADSIREQITKKVVAAMEGITEANGYTLNVQSVIRAKLPGVQIQEFPTILVVEGIETSDQPSIDGSPFGKWSNFFNIACIGYTADEDMGEALNELLANIQKAMHANTQWDGLAVLTTQVSAEPFILEEVNFPMAGITAIFQIRYRFQDKDPFSQ